jgi:hypothetical protein
MENKELEKIRHFKSSLEDFENYWKGRNVPMSPYKEVDYLYPKKKTVKDDSVPRQTFRFYHEHIKNI